MAQVYAAKRLKHNDTNFIAGLFILKRAIRFKDKWYSVGTYESHGFVTHPALFVVTKMLL